MNELNKLEFLSIVNKISIELSNHLGSEIGNDKSVAEFVISLFGGKSEREEDFMVRIWNLVSYAWKMMELIFWECVHACVYCRGN